MQKKQWQDVVALIAGAWLVASPWALGQAEPATRPVYNAVVVGIATIVFSLLDLAKDEKWESVVNLILGLWAVISPWALHYTGAHDMVLSTVAAGAVLAIVSLWQVVERYNLPDRFPQ